MSCLKSDVQPDPDSVPESTAGSELYLRSCRLRGRVESRRGAPAPTASKTPVTRCFLGGLCVLKLKGNRALWKWPQDWKSLARQLRDDGGRCHHFLRHLPAVTLPCHLNCISSFCGDFWGLGTASIRSNGHSRGSPCPCVFSVRADALLHMKPLLCGSIVF